MSERLLEALANCLDLDEGSETVQAAFAEATAEEREVFFNHLRFEALILDTWRNPRCPVAAERATRGVLPRSRRDFVHVFRVGAVAALLMVAIGIFWLWKVSGRHAQPERIALSPAGEALPAQPLRRGETPRVGQKTPAETLAKEGIPATAEGKGPRPDQSAKTDESEITGPELDLKLEIAGRYRKYLNPDMEQFGGVAAVVLGVGYGLKRDGRYDEAIEVFQQIIEVYTRPRWAWSVARATYELADCYYIQKDMNRAREAFQEALEKYPNAQTTIGRPYAGVHLSTILKVDDAFTKPGEGPSRLMKDLQAVFPESALREAREKITKEGGTPAK